MANSTTSSTFQQDVLESETPVLVDFWAEWCGPCRMLAPVIDALSLQASGYKVLKVNIDDEPDLAQQYGVMSIPTLILFRAGQPAGQLVGVQPKEAIESLLQKAL